MPPPRRKSGRDKRKVQTRLSFETSSPVSSSSKATAARIVYQDPRMPKKKDPSSSSRSRPYHTNDNDNADDDSDVFADGKPYAVVVNSSPISVSQKKDRSFMAPASSSLKKKSKRTTYPVNRIDSESSSDEEVRIIREKPKKKPSFLVDDSESSLQSPPRAFMEDGVVHTPKTPKTETPKSKKKYISSRSFISGGYLAPVPTSSPQSANRKRNQADDPSSVSRKSKVKEIIALSSGEHSDTDAIVERNSPIKMRPLARRRIRTSGDNEEEKESQINHKRRRDSSSDDDDEPVRSSPVKRRKTVLHEHRPSETKTKKLGSRRLTRRTNTPKKRRTDKQKKLELIRRRRAGEKIDELTESSSSEEEEERGAYDTNSDHEALSIFDDEDPAEGIDAVRHTLRPGNRNQDDDSFVVEDDDEPLGVPSYGINDIPLEFTHQAHKPMREHFKDAIEWMVQKKINPSFNQKDPIYIQAFRKLEPEARGLANSKFSSSAWSEDFTRALWARPDLHEEEIGDGDEGDGKKCDACGRSNHPAKFKVQLRGKPYNHTTLEDVESGNDSEDGDESEGEDSDHESINSKGQTVLGEDTVFYLGRFCRANAERAHSLIHWKHALNEWVVQMLEQQGFLEPEKLAERIKWSQRKLNTFANKIVDEWTDNGEIKSLYKDFKNSLESARNQKSDRWNA